MKSEKEVRRMLFETAMRYHDRYPGNGEDDKLLSGQADRMAALLEVLEVDGYGGAGGVGDFIDDFVLVSGGPDRYDIYRLG